MLELSNIVLKRGYTITISKQKGQDSLHGSYVKRFPNGLHPYELPEEEIKPLHNFPNIVERLNDGAILQVSKPICLLQGIVGKEKTEGPYCETEYLEVHAQISTESYFELLYNLDMQLASMRTQDEPNDQKQYRKLYKGEDRYE